MIFGLGKKSKTENNAKTDHGKLSLQHTSSSLNTGKDSPAGHSLNGASHEKISIPRSDGKKHDLTAVINAPGVASIIKQESLKQSENDSSRSTDSEHHDEHDRINIMRSDGLTHDIIRVFKAQSDIGQDAFRLKPSKASHRNSKGMININFSMSSSVLISKNNSSAKEAVQQQQQQHAMTSTNILGKLETSYYPKSVRIVHMSDTHNFLKKTPQRSPFLPHGDILVHTGKKHKYIYIILILITK